MFHVSTILFGWFRLFHSKSKQALHWAVVMCANTWLKKQEDSNNYTSGERKNKSKINIHLVEEEKRSKIIIHLVEEKRGVK